MPGQLLDELNQIKKDMVVALARYTLSGEAEENTDAILQSVLLSWFETVKSPQDFYQKYASFKQLEKLLVDSMLFDMVETISTPVDEAQARHAIALYEQLHQDENHQQLFNACGYRLPNEFGNIQCYYDGTLRHKVQFFRQFSERLEKIYSDLSKKGGNTR